MKLTEEQQKILDGEKGEAMQKVYRTLVMYGEIYGADGLIPISSGKGHLVTRLSAP